VNEALLYGTSLFISLTRKYKTAIRFNDLTCAPKLTDSKLSLYTHRQYVQLEVNENAKFITLLLSTHYYSVSAVHELHRLCRAIARYFSWKDVK